MEVSEQVSSLAFGALAIVTTGAAVVCVIVKLDVDVQPFAPVTVTV
jgi:hypothetical protein